MMIRRGTGGVYSLFLAFMGLAPASTGEQLRYGYFITHNAAGRLLLWMKLLSTVPYMLSFIASFTGNIVNPLPI